MTLYNTWQLPFYYIHMVNKARGGGGGVRWEIEFIILNCLTKALNLTIAGFLDFPCSSQLFLFLLSHVYKLPIFSARALNEYTEVLTVSLRLRSQKYQYFCVDSYVQTPSQLLLLYICKNIFKNQLICFIAQFSNLIFLFVFV